MISAECVFPFVSLPFSLNVFAVCSLHFLTGMAPKKTQASIHPPQMVHRVREGSLGKASRSRDLTRVREGQFLELELELLLLREHEGLAAFAKKVGLGSVVLKTGIWLISTSLLPWEPTLEPFWNTIFIVNHEAIDFYKLVALETVIKLQSKIWLHECCPSLDGRFIDHIRNNLPRILNWVVKDQLRNKQVALQIFSLQCEQLKNITPIDAEKQLFDVRGLNFEIEVDCTDSQPDSFRVFGTQLPKTQSMHQSTGGDSEPTNDEVMKELQGLKLFVETKFEEVLAAIA
nr:uncharacterized protein LOC117276961 [Nicotiana tomentosiformis]